MTGDQILLFDDIKVTAEFGTTMPVFAERMQAGDNGRDARVAFLF